MSNKIGYKIGDRVKIVQVRGINNISYSYKKYIGAIATVTSIEIDSVCLDIPGFSTEVKNTVWYYDEIKPYNSIQLFTL